MSTKDFPVPPHRVVIIGGGFSGALVAQALIENTQAPLSIHVVEPRAALGGGIAYSTSELGHLLNGPLSMINFGPNDPLPFEAWISRYVESHGLVTTSWRDGERTFVPRRIFGLYMQERLERSAIGAAKRLDFTHVRSKAVDIDFQEGRAFAYLENQPRLEADHVLLATGAPQAQLAFADPSILGSESYIGDPWDSKLYSRLATAKHVIIIGAGLTMLDALVSLDAHGFKGSVLVISRRGLSVAPSHPVTECPEVVDPERLPLTARTVLRTLQHARKKIAGSGGAWQSLVSAMREATPLIWDGAAEREKRIYLRHLRAYWEVARHRSAPPTARLAEAWRAEGRLVSRAARIHQLVATEDGSLQVGLRFRGASVVTTLRPDAVINCIGAEYDIRKLARSQALFRNLLARGAIRPGPASFGIDAEKNGAVIGSSGETNRHFTAIGPVIRGVHWESSSIGEIVAQLPPVVARLSMACDHALEVS